MSKSKMKFEVDCLSLICNETYSRFTKKNAMIEGSIIEREEDFGATFGVEKGPIYMA